MFRLKLISCVMLLVSLTAQDSQAQLFGRFRTYSTCPSGGCPTTASTGHWSYPGTIDSHLRSTHGVSPAGMSMQQKLSLHDSLHTGTSNVTTYSSPVVESVVTRYAPPVVAYQVVPTEPTVQRWGDSDRQKFRVAFLQANRQARANGQITAFEFATLAVAARSPAALDKIQQVVHETAIQEGLATATAIDWDGLIGFLEKLIPLIIKIIGLFG